MYILYMLNKTINVSVGKLAKLFEFVEIGFNIASLTLYKRKYCYNC